DHPRRHQPRQTAPPGPGRGRLGRRPRSQPRPPAVTPGQGDEGLGARAGPHSRARPLICQLPRTSAPGGNPSYASIRIRTHRAGHPHRPARTIRRTVRSATDPDTPARSEYIVRKPQRPGTPYGPKGPPETPAPPHGSDERCEGVRAYGSAVEAAARSATAVAVAPAAFRAEGARAVAVAGPVVGAVAAVTVA